MTNEDHLADVRKDVKAAMAELAEDANAAEPFVREMSDYDYRSEALSAAVRVCEGETPSDLVLMKARAFEAYLRGPAVPAEPETED